MRFCHERPWPRYQALVLCHLIATTIWITSRFKTSYAVDRPLHLSFCTLLLCSVFWYSWDRFSSAGSLGDKHSRAWSPKQVPYRVRRYIGYWSYILNLPKESAILVGAIILRLITVRSIIVGVQCSWDGIEILLPFLLILFDWATYHDTAKPGLPLQGPSKPAYPRDYIIWAGLTTICASSLFSSAQSSTYICPSTDFYAISIRFMQCLGLFLDTGIILTVSKLPRNTAITPWKSLRYLTLAAAEGIFYLACFFLLKNLIQSELVDFYWSLRLPAKAKTDLFFDGLLCASFISSAVGLMTSTRPATIFTIAGCAAFLVSALQHQNPINFNGHTLSLSLFTFASATGFLLLEKGTPRLRPNFDINRSSEGALLVFCVLALASSIFFGAKILLPTSVDMNLFSAPWVNHPIELLIPNAIPIDKVSSTKWVGQAEIGMSLDETVKEYQRRYGIPPPPNFDKWHAFAVSRGSIILHDFGQIHDDLQPFWGLDPSKIRKLTSHMLETPWTDIAGLRVSNGTTRIAPYMPPTHRWMMEGAAAIINTFAEWLPDMDLAFNLNDESRVVIPWDKMNGLLRAAGLARNQLNTTQSLKSFSSNTPGTWRSGFLDPSVLRSDEFISKYFSGNAFLVPSFDDYGTISCHPGSLSRKWKWWNHKQICYKCPLPHSAGPFVRNWTLSGSLCHQPDLADLHGFSISPSKAFKPTKQLLPIFSQSKIPTFSDILYPSPWNYQDKVSYDNTTDVPFTEKESTLFWRGATSEGYSERGTWPGMQRQRFVHLVTKTHDKSTTVPLLVPDPKKPYHGGGYVVHETLLTDVLANTNINVSFVDTPTRCSSTDCATEKAELPFTNITVDFQDHWKYKYLMDMDGAGFSGRFLPFLQSRSLVFRAAAFRQWFDERLTPWRHFVPVDGRLLELWDLLAYFGGRGEGRVGAHQDEASNIAEEGREWAGRVLRKEDMEVYMFRLLLEWGRIVDDRREELGFVLEDV